MSAENASHYMSPALKDLSLQTLLQVGFALSRLAEPEEIAATVAFLVSSDTSHFTGSSLAVDGGKL